MIAVSTTTRTGQALARERFEANRVFYCPLDLPWAVRAYLNALQPRLFILAETEFWPNLLSGCYRRKIPVAVVNARISDRSWPRYRRLLRLWRPFLEPLSRVLAQSETDAERLKAIGCLPERVTVAGNLKFDVRAVEETDATRLLKVLARNLRLIVAGSTLEGEEAALLEAWPRLLQADPQLAMILAPRHPERFAAVATLLEKSGFSWVKRSDLRSSPEASLKPLNPGQIVLLDTIGELASVYSLASVAFVGGSLIPAGGHNPLEPAQFGVPIVMGPHFANFRAITEDLLAHDAICITENDTLVTVLVGLLCDRTAANAMGERARQVFEQQAGATGRCVEALKELLPGEERIGKVLMNHSFSARLLLIPLVPLYRLALALRELQFRTGIEPVRRLRFPVVSVGNLSTGGSGKTPLTIALASALQQRDLRVDVLSRGYGRQSKLAARVNPNGTAAEFGDEPLLIARETGLPVYVAPQRYDAGLLAEAEQTHADKCFGLVGQGFSPDTKSAKLSGALAPEVCIHLLDDGFQHRQLARAVNILLIDSRDWQDWLLPVGNLREPLRAIRRASVIAIPANEPELANKLQAWGWQGPVWRVRRTMEIPSVSGPIAAFCGIARPEQFFAGLESAGRHLAAHVAFSDHHRYTARDLERLIAAARVAKAAAIITTEKDLVRLGMLASTFPVSLPLMTARLRIEIEDQTAAIDWLINRLVSWSASPTT